METNKQTATGFKELLNSMMKKRWYITAIVLGGFMLIIGGIFASIIFKTEMAEQWKELLLLLLGAFIGSYGKIVDYWFSDTDKDKMLVQKMDEEDGITLSNTIDNTPTPSTPTISSSDTKSGTQIDEDGDGVMDGIDIDGDGKIDVYFAHRQCEHVWGDSDMDGDEECLKCGKIKDF